MSSVSRKGALFVDDPPPCGKTVVERKSHRHFVTHKMRTTTMMPTSCLYRPLHHFSGGRRHKEQPQKRELLCWFSFRSRIVDRNRRRKWSSKRRTSSASSSSSSASVDDTRELHVLTFDLDDTVWPTLPVVTAANESYIKWLQTRVQNFPETRVMNELMKGIREEREEMFRMRGEEHVVRFTFLICSSLFC